MSISRDTHAWDSHTVSADSLKNFWTHTLVKYWSSTGQALVKPWSNAGRSPRRDRFPPLSARAAATSSTAHELTIVFN